MATLQRVYGGDEAAPHQSQRRLEDRLAYGLGWFSIGLGLAEVLAPKRVARLAGVKDRRNVIRAMGVRELTSGVGILATRRPTGWLWSRVGGDALDLSLLGAHLTPGNHRRRRTAIATAAVAGVTALDVLCSERLRRRPERVRGAIAVNKTPEEAEQFWRENAPSPLKGAAVRFEAAPGGRGAFVRIEMDTNQDISSALREFKQRLELGEVVKSDASIHRRMHPAQPPAEVPA